MNSEEKNICPECGAQLPPGRTCWHVFGELLAREFEDTEPLNVHHLTVLCYMLQHPSFYSDEAYDWAITALRSAVRDGVAPVELRRRAEQYFKSGAKIKVTRRDQGATARPARRWSMTVADAVGESVEGHNERVRAWAEAVLADLE
jgi:hypothetical protein